MKNIMRIYLSQLRFMYEVIDVPASLFLNMYFDFGRSCNVKWYYNERHHGKRPMDGLGETV